MTLTRKFLILAWLTGVLGSPLRADYITYENYEIHNPKKAGDPLIVLVKSTLNQKEKKVSKWTWHPEWVEGNGIKEGWRDRYCAQLFLNKKGYVIVHERNGYEAKKLLEVLVGTGDDRVGLKDFSPWGAPYWDKSGKTFWIIDRCNNSAQEYDLATQKLLQDIHPEKLNLDSILSFDYASVTPSSMVCPYK